MSDAVKEQLSAVLDNELAGAELDLLLRRLERNAELRQTLGRYALCSEALRRNERPRPASPDFAAGVMAALESEPAGFSASRRRKWAAPTAAAKLKPVAGAAVAAGVAALAVLTIQQGGVEPGPTAVNPIAEQRASPPPVETLVASSEAEPSYTVPRTTSSTPFAPAARLTNYVVAHAEYSSPLGRRSVLSGVLSEHDESLEPEPAEARGLVETKVTHP
ncbi:MAG TPA: sigma-E factor negative regulatory protein [Steroidobacter sp.]|jgi:negative regulator of sigma E activity|nr:sigma-E factor negative regulatory protein [Steroidobacteraceae bacterium]HLS82810.1 sigma-E factor negative regulatory protein [Steroidobacter sp.]